IQRSFHSALYRVRVEIISTKNLSQCFISVGKRPSTLTEFEILVQ
ncbi:1161_t:CDS:1, partial [Dentiscutata erythropus]